jgi:hypothetical protein
MVTIVMYEYNTVFIAEDEVMNEDGTRGERAIRSRRRPFVQLRTPLPCQASTLVAPITLESAMCWSITMGNLLRLPVEVIAYIQSLLDLASLIATSTTCRLLRAVASDPLLNPWRAPILRALNQYQCEYPPELRNLSVYSTVPRHNWIEILALARSDFLLLEATLPNLEERDWEEAFKRRFLPSWKKWKDGGRWKAVFFKFVIRYYSYPDVV